MQAISDFPFSDAAVAQARRAMESAAGHLRGGRPEAALAVLDRTLDAGSLDGFHLLQRMRAGEEMVGMLRSANDELRRMAVRRRRILDRAITVLTAQVEGERASREQLRHLLHALQIETSWPTLDDRDEVIEAQLEAEENASARRLQRVAG